MIEYGFEIVTSKLAIPKARDKTLYSQVQNNSHLDRMWAHLKYSRLKELLTTVDDGKVESVEGLRTRLCQNPPYPPK